MNSEIDSTVEVEQDKATKHIVGDTLRDVPQTVAVVEQDIAGATITKYYLSVGDRYAEVLPDNPRATPIKRHTLMKRLDDVSESAITIQFQDQLTPTTQRHIAERVAPLRDEFDTSVSDDADDYSAPPEQQYDDRVADNPDDVLDNGASPIGTSDVHGGGW